MFVQFILLGETNTDMLNIEHKQYSLCCESIVSCTSSVLTVFLDKT